MKTARTNPATNRCKMNMTPMIDVTFQLLIFFILVTELQRIITEDVALPQAERARPDIHPGGHRVTINLTRAGDIIVARARLSPNALGKLLAMEREVYRDVHVLIRADRDIEYGAVQQIVQQCLLTGLRKLSFAALKRQTDAQ